MIMLVERYCKTYIFLFLFTSRNDIYIYTWETLLDSSIIDSDFNLFSLTNYFMRMMQAVLQQHNSNQKLNSEILTAESKLELRKLNKNQKFLKKNLDLKSEILIESELKNMNALFLTNSLLNSSSEIRNFSST